MEFLIGTIFGVAMVIVLSIVGLVIWLGSMLSTKKKYSKEEIERLVKNAQTVGSVAYRYSIVEDIMNRQLELAAQLEAPTKGTSHSRWKQDIQKQIMQMEEEKMDLFRSILEDGVDPVLVTMSADGQREDIKMSEALKRFDADNETFPPTTPSRKKTESKNPRENESNVVQMFKSEEKPNESSNPEVDRPR
jgi:hypothetical protein